MRTFGRHEGQWRVHLGPHYALFLDMLGKQVLVAGRDDVSIEEQRNAVLSSRLMVCIRIREKSWNALMPPAGFAKFQAWKLAETDPDALPPERPPQPFPDAYTRRAQIS
jgi:hypothetical protein